MFSSLSKLSPPRDPLLFDIRLKSTDHDVILLKGKQDEASSVLLSGKIVLSVLEPTQIKALSLRLVGKLRLNVPITHMINGVNAKKYLKYEKRIFNYNWDEFHMDHFFDDLYENYGKSNFSLSGRSSPLNIGPSQDSNSGSNSSSSNTLTASKRTKSNSSLLSMGNGSNYHTLAQGNYEFPFSTVLPGSLTESVEGLPNATVIYKLEAIIERPSGSDLICQKPLRVVRTLSPDAVELSETVAAENSWPNKVDYTLSCPAKSIAIGSATPIYIVIVPLLKGLKLGNIKISLLETSQYLGNFGGIINQDRIVSKMKIKDPIGHLAQLKQKNDDRSTDNFEPIDFQDRWEIDTVLNIPPSLSKCTQDCDVYNNIKVRHKLKFNISLINPDGHVSELRATLPIQLFISPFVTVGVKNTKTLELEEDRKTNTKVKDINSNNNANTSFSSETFFHNDEDRDDEEVIFASAAPEVELHAGSLENNFYATTAISELMTPPNYGKHVYDRLWGEIPVSQTPISTRPTSPVHNSSVSNLLHDTTMDDDLTHLNGSLQNLGLLRDSQVTPVHLSTTNPFRDSQFPTFAISDSDAQFPEEIMDSPSVAPGFDHISRASSFSNLRQASSTSLKKVFEMAELSRLPSYDKALHSDTVEDDLPPTYPNFTDNSFQESQEKNNILKNSNKVILEKPQSVRHRSSSFLSVALRQRSSSRGSNSSNTSLNLLGRNNTEGSLSVPMSNSNSSISLNKLASSGRKSSFNMVPIPLPIIRQDREEEGSKSSYSMQRDMSTSSSKARQRATSFPAFMNMFSKKDQSEQQE